MNNDVMKLNIESNAFNTMKNDFDKVLKQTLGNMTLKGSENATLTLKINISLTKQEVPAFEQTSGALTREIIKPKFDHKVNSVMQIKSEESGSLKGDYELVWDEDSNDYVMKPINNGQGSIFEDDYGFKDVDDEATGLPERVINIDEKNSEFPDFL